MHEFCQSIIKIYKSILLLMPFNLILVLSYIIIFGNFFLMLMFVPSIIIYVINPIKSIQYYNIIKNIFMDSTSFIIKIILFPNIYVNSNDIFKQIKFSNNHKNLLISNHISELDFLLGPIFSLNLNLTNINLRIAKKDVGYQIPISGFFGLLSGDIFLHRNINLDMNKLNKKINFNFMLLYPEGSCFTKQKKIISDNYCDKNQLIKFKYHLYPRMTGLELIINNNKEIKYIYDLTIIYDEVNKNYGQHYNIIGYVLNKFKISNKVFIQINRYKINKKISFDKKMIENIYLEKDNFVRKFDITCNNFKPIEYNYSKGFISFIFINSICIFSIYLYFKYNFIKYLYFFQILTYYFYFYFYV